MCEQICNTYGESSLGCTPCIARTWDGCVQDGDVSSASEYVRDMIRSPLYWLLLSVWSTIVYQADFFKVVGTFVAPETPRHVSLSFTGEEKVIELLRLQSFFKTLTFKSGKSIRHFSDLSSKERWIGGYNVEWVVCTLLPQRMYNWSEGRVWFGKLLPNVTSAVAFLAGCFYVTEMQEDLLDKRSGISQFAEARWRQIEGDVGVVFALQLAKVLRLSLLTAGFWWCVRLGDVPARAVVFLKPVYSVLTYMLAFNAFMSEQLETHLLSLFKANKAVANLGGTAKNASQAVVEEVARRGSFGVNG